MSDYLDSISEHTNTIRHIAYDLDRLSAAFDATGNNAMAEEMAFMSVSLVDTQKGINNAVSENINHELDRSKQGVTAASGANQTKEAE